MTIAEITRCVATRDLATLAHHMAQGAQTSPDLAQLQGYHVAFMCCAALSALAGWLSLYLQRAHPIAA